ncbi:hypothetical protein [Thermoactinospora rubra]|uniref:hypothetical protein n=1 Tax=Thermoactinospora rubra TaxID=1088767 RepID=UPI000A112217|nr:hypothetical protein [Thermoactinospora rubra]
MRYTLQQVAEEIGVSVEDVTVVAQIELGGPPLYEPGVEDDLVSEEGRRRLLVHYSGGSDPDAS